MIFDLWDFPPLLGKTVWWYGILKNSFCSWHPKVIHFWHRKMKMRPRTWMIWSLQKELPPFTVAWPGWTVVWPCGAVCLNPYPPCSGKPWPTCFGGRTVRSFESRIRFNRFAETTHRPWYLGMSHGRYFGGIPKYAKLVEQNLASFKVPSRIFSSFSRDLECPNTEMYSFEPRAKLQHAAATFAGSDLKGLDKKLEGGLY